jgi:hypothetical protein
LTGQQSLTIELCPGRSPAIFGRLWLAREIAKQIQSPTQFDPIKRALRIPARHLDDFLAAAETWTGVDVRVEQVTA